MLIPFQGTGQTDLEWAGSLSGSNYKEVLSMVSDNDNNIIVVGYFRDTVDFALDGSSFKLVSNGWEDIFIVKYNSNGEVLWGFNLGDENHKNHDRCNSVAVDDLGNIYVTGYYYGEVDFDPGEGVYTINQYLTRNIFVAKYTPEGALAWAFNFDDGFGSIGVSIAVDNNRNVLVTGKLHGMADFDPGTDTVYHTAGGLDDIFIAKYDTDMNYQWSYNLGTSVYQEYEDELGRAVTTDKWNNVYCVGSFMDTADFDPGPDTNLFVSNGNGDIFIMKFNAAGEYLWAFSSGSIYNDEIIAVSADKDGDITVAGNFSLTVDFDPSDAVAELTTSVGYDSFIAKYDADGNYLWASETVGWQREKGNLMIIDTIGNVYVTGDFENTIDFDPGPDSTIITSNGGIDFYISKYDKNGNFKWANTMGSSNDNLYEKGDAIIIDREMNIVFAGNFNGTVDFDPDTSVYNLISEGLLNYSDAAVVKYSQCQDMFFYDFYDICEGDSIFLAGEYRFESGTYNESFPMLDGCDSMIVSELTVNQLPDAFEITGEINVIEGQIETYSVPEDVSLFYVWELENGIIINWINDYSAEIQWGDLGAGYIHIVAENLSGCIGDTVSMEVNIGVDNIQDPEEKAKFRIYPNPSSAIFIIDGVGMNSVEITDVLGQIISIFKSAENSHMVDLSDHPAGVYFARIKTEKGMIVKRLNLE